MNQEKAREFFSAYYEGTLDGALRQAFEQRLNADATLQADYAAFVETINELTSMRHEEIEIPIYLSDRIATRLEEVQEQSRPRVPVWTNWIRGLAFSGLAAAAIVGAVINLQSQGGDIGEANLVGAPAAAPMLKFAGEGSSVKLAFAPTGKATVVISSGITGNEIKRYELDGTSTSGVRALDAPLTNDHAQTALFSVRVNDEAPILVAVPGTGRPSTASGEGSVTDLAVAIASQQRVPVIVKVADTTKRANWNLEGTSGRDSALDALKPLGYSLEEREPGVLTILDR